MNVLKIDMKYTEVTFSYLDIVNCLNPFCSEAEGGYLILLHNFVFYFEVFQKYSNSTLQFY